MHTSDGLGFRTGISFASVLVCNPSKHLQLGGFFLALSEGNMTSFYEN